MLEAILQAALTELAAGRPVTLATITAAHGSTPRGTGAMMVVGQSGVLAGTIGGGTLEHECTQLALDPPRPVMEFYLDNQQAASLGMVCGGSAQVLFTPLTDGAVLTQALERLKNFQPGWLLLPLAGGGPVLVTENLLDHPGLVDWAGQPHLSLPLAQPGRFYLLGGGHVALELARILDVLNYPYIVVDDRPEFSNPQRFPRARRALCCPFPDLAQHLTGPLAPGPKDGICIMTRGHLADTDALRFALNTPTGYIGVMGSRSKREKVFAQLAQEGFEHVPQRVVTPIGLPIGGQTPAEVAVSIAAQLVQFRNQ